MRSGSQHSSAGRTASGADPTPYDVIEEWFGGADGRLDRPRRRRWFRGGRALDGRLRERFCGAIEMAARGELDDWSASAEGNLALVLLLDQFPRHVHRGRAEAFAHDGQALALADAGIARGDLDALPLVRGAFLVMPFEHDESIASQERALALFRMLRAKAPPELLRFAQGMLDSAEEHAAIIREFGRYPHRNEALGRVSTPAESIWLAGRARRFGQRAPARRRTREG